MEVICKGHKICDDKMNCSHSKVHKHNINCEQSEYNLEICYCSNIYLRKDKLKKIIRLNESNLQKR